MNSKRYDLLSWDDFQELIVDFPDRFNLKIDQIDNYFETKISSERWKPFFEWEEFDDLTIFQKLTYPYNFKKGINVIITFKSYEKDWGPFKVDGGYIESFISEYFNIFGEAFFSGVDVIIVNVLQKIAFIFNHNFYYVVVNLNEL